VRFCSSFLGRNGKALLRFFSPRTSRVEKRCWKDCLERGPFSFAIAGPRRQSSRNAILGLTKVGKPNKLRRLRRKKKLLFTQWARPVVCAPRSGLCCSKSGTTGPGQEGLAPFWYVEPERNARSQKTTAPRICEKKANETLKYSTRRHDEKKKKEKKPGIRPGRSIDRDLLFAVRT